jgi:hypothetical protein
LTGDSAESDFTAFPFRHASELQGGGAENEGLVHFLLFRQLQSLEKRLVFEHPASQDQSAHVAASQSQGSHGQHDILGNDGGVFPAGLRCRRTGQQNQCRSSVQNGVFAPRLSLPAQGMRSAFKNHGPVVPPVQGQFQEEARQREPGQLLQFPVHMHGRLPDVGEGVRMLDDYQTDFLGVQAGLGVFRHAAHEVIGFPADGRGLEMPDAPGFHQQIQESLLIRDGTDGFRFFNGGMADSLPRADGDAVAAVDAVLFCGLFQGVESAKAGEDAGFFAQAAMDALFLVNSHFHIW